MSKYIIQKGDTLSGIAAANNTTVDELARINNIADPNKIYAGNELILREGDSTGGDKVQYSSTGTGSSSASGAASGSGNSTVGNASTGKASGIDYTFEASDTVSAANAALEAHMATRPGYTDKWGDQISSIIEQITSRDKFTYDVNSDALYQQYKDQYTALGKLAMQDTMGQAAAMTGGYGSSYASTAGNQAYQSYLSQLNAVVPELYGMARDQYNQEGQDLYNQYGLLVDQENQDYSRYMDSYNQWASETDYLTGRADTLYGREYSEWADKIANQQWDQSFSYQQERDAVSDSQWNQSFNYQQERDKVSDSQWNQSFNYQQERDKVSDSQWQQSHQLDVNADQRAAEAWQMEKDAYEEAKASGEADGSGNNQAALEHVASMSSAQIVDTMSAYSADGDNKGLAAFLDDCVASGRLTPEQADNYYDQYRTGDDDDVVDTTVNGAPTGSGGGNRFNTSFNTIY